MPAPKVHDKTSARQLISSHIETYTQNKLVFVHIGEEEVPPSSLPIIEGVKITVQLKQPCTSIQYVIKPI